jgi:DNA repair protein RecN (Recombination protein N)
VIRTLRLANLAVIEELELELGPGLHAITGETGAGKSVLLGALALLRGQRGSAELVRAGAAEATVEAVVQYPALVARAAALGLAEPGDDELLVQRTLSREGRGRVHVNGRLATSALLAELFGDAIEVIGQGEHQRLLRPEVQTDLLDQSGGLGAQVAELEELFGAHRTAERELRERRERATELARREDQLRFEIEQIDAAALRVGEEEELVAERGRLAHADRLAQDAAALLDGLDGESGVRDRIAGLSSRLRGAVRLDPSLAPLEESLARARLELDDASRVLERYAGSLEPDPARLDRIESRLEALRRLRSRYGESVEAILEHRGRAAAELERVSGGEARAAELEAACADLRARLAEAAASLGKARREAAQRLEADVTREMRALDLPRASFEVRFDPVDVGPELPCGARGAERARFVLQANPGEPAERLRGAASGGELARLLLALRNALREAERGAVLLFDEVDAGIGGRTARRVGERLRGLARRHQVLCITHLPQIAALGDTHHRLWKVVRGERTHTLCEPLRDEARVDEIARMAGGGRVTEAARAHARELLART